jgi:hypothetical protein
MSTSLKSRDNAVFNHREERTGKNDLHRSPINDDLTSAYTWTTPEIGLFCGRANDHDA